MLYLLGLLTMLPGTLTLGILLRRAKRETRFWRETALVFGGRHVPDLQPPQAGDGTTIFFESK